MYSMKRLKNKSSTKVHRTDNLPPLSTASTQKGKGKKLVVNGKQSSDEDEDFFKNLYQLKSPKEVDSMDSDYENEGKGFAPADIFLTVNQISKELEMRERLMNNAYEEKREEKKPKTKTKTKTGVNVDEVKRKNIAFDRAVEMVIQKHFQHLKLDDEMENVDEDPVESIIPDFEEEVDYYDVDTQQEVLKMAEALGKRVLDYHQKHTGLEKYIDSAEGITDLKLQKYFRKQLKKPGAKKKLDTETPDSSGEPLKIDEKVDILYPLSTEEKRKKLANLFEDLNSETFQQIKSAANKRTHTRFHHSIIREHGSTKNPAERDVLINIDSKGEPAPENEAEFQIMFSDVSESEDEVNEVDVSSAKNPPIFKEKCDSVIQVVKDTAAKSMKDDKIPKVERLLNKYKQKQEIEDRKKREFNRWFGNEDYDEEERDDEPIYNVPCWKSGWTRLDSEVKEQLLESKRHIRKRQEGDAIDEYKRQQKEYALMDKVVNGGHDKDNVDLEAKDSEVGERWIRIKKGTLMKNYQVKCRQGMYYLVEKKHIQQRKKRGKYSKKRMIRADGRSVTQQKTSKERDKFNIKRYLGKKKEIFSEGEQREKKIFLRKGEAAEEIRKILTQLERKNFGEGKLPNNKLKKSSEWSRAKFIQYFKEKCKTLGVELSSESEDEDSRGMFRKYFLLYYDTQQELKQKKSKTEQDSKYPLGMFKQKKSREDDVISSDDSIIDHSGTDETSEEEEFPIADLASEIFLFPVEDTVKATTEPPRKVSFKRYGDQFRFSNEGNDLRQIRMDKLKNNKTINDLPQHCSELYNFPRHIRDGFFRPKDSVNTAKLDEFFDGKYLNKENHYLREKRSDEFPKVHREVVDEMRKEGLIKVTNYKFLTDEEIVNILK